MSAYGFDLEIARLDFSNETTPADGLGISCAGLVSSHGDTSLWYGTQAPVYENFGPKLSIAGARHLLSTLEGIVKSEGVIVTWNGLNFDFPVLAVESHQPDRTAKLAVSSSHVDLMVLFASIRRHALGLKAAAEGVGSFKGGGGIEHGDQAPLMWAQGQTSSVLQYLLQDCKATIDVFRYLVEKGGFTWISKSGNPNQFVLPKEMKDWTKWTVDSVMSRVWGNPPGWVTNPLSAKDFIQWVPQNLRGDWR